MKIAITTYYTSVSPYKEKWEEQMRTWVPQAKKLGIPVYSLKAKEDFISEKKYIQKDDFIIFKGKTKFENSRNDITLSWALDAVLCWAKDNNFDYVYFADNDTFIEPTRFLSLIQEYSQNPEIDYAGCCLPYRGWTPSNNFQTFIPIDEKEGHASGGSGYILSKKAIKLASSTFLKEIELTEEGFKWANDKILGNCFKKHNIPLYHDSRISPESPSNPLLVNPHNNPIPYIGDPNSFLVGQHGANGHMDEISNKLGYNKINLIFSTSRRFNLFKDTVESLIHHNPDINDLIENVYILDDRSSYEDRNKMEDLISQNFPHKGRLVTFNNSSYPYAYVEKLNFIQNISQGIEYTLFIEDDRKNISPLNLPSHLEYLENNHDLDQISFIENHWIQDEETKTQISLEGEYWNASQCSYFRYCFGQEYRPDNQITWHWSVSTPILSLGATLNRNTIYSRAKFKPIKYYELDFHDQLNSKFIYTLTSKFIHTGWRSSIEQSKK
jgi:hypothetical protein